jgi:beta-glucosidase
MQGRTYRFMKAEPMYPFGFGLSYAKFEYSASKTSSSSVSKKQSFTVTTTLSNKGKQEGEEVVQLYVTDVDTKENAPVYALKAFKRVKIAAGASKDVSFNITPDMLAIVNEKGESVIDSGHYKIYIGSCSPSARNIALGGSKPVELDIAVK